MRKLIAIENPKIFAEWDYVKNIGIDPDKLTGGSNKKVWWLCEHGHSFHSQVNKRFSRGQGCPYCAGNKVWLGFNDLRSTHPHIADSWDYERNGDLVPEQFSIGSDIKIWWKCKKCEHSWNAVLYSRKSCGCPACAGNIFVVGENDLQTVNSTLAKEWNNDKNGTLSPASVAANDNRKFWWVCEKGHNWQATVSARNRGNGCPYCANRKLLPGFNDLLTVAPELATEWHYDKNGDLRPEHILAGSHKSVWWRCSSGHEWQTKVIHRIQGHGCPYDAGKIIITGETDFKTRYPNLCEEWDYEKNGALNPNAIACHSHNRFWWICPEGHSYQSTTSNRIRGNGCSYCSGKRPIVGETDFGTVHPELIDEWDFEKNAPLHPEHVTAGSHKKAWWHCKNGHSWETVIYHRHIERGCPYCSGLLAIPGETDFGSILPELANEWDTERNDGIAPEDFKPYSNKRVWWHCENGHHWLSTVGARFAGAGCPYCRGKIQMRTRLV